jgi:hypothetical protein
MPENNEIDLDLDALDAQLREAVGEPTSVKINGKVVHIANAADWSGAAMQYSQRGNWDEWAKEVIETDEELDTFLDARLKNYQLEAIFNKCAELSNQSPGKSHRSGASSRGSRRK